ncbi:hypothetical protein N8J89_32400 [Crossiella sp. CA-258035]|uniref:hypothetical protein n=1 Tax=Crossiella sp. CA-258035 TaxID=2981138 RepID=UPI0024BBF4BE|nr:hypothetical protein [Crossiella sp. CA-258035]WHT17786.1 hypothetical protein N8J89_32400 [Crossiella sp. CA-258035]
MSEAVQRANERLREVDERMRKFFDQVNQAVNSVPEPLRWVIPRIDLLVEAVTRNSLELGKQLEDLLGDRGDADRVREAAEQWSKDIAGKLNDVAGAIDPGKMDTTLEWEGRAAEAYRLTIPTQVSGLTGLKDLATQMRGSLVNLGNSIESFWVGITVALIVALIGIASAVALTVSVAGIPLALLILVAVLPSVAGLIGSLITGLLAHVNTCKAEQSALQEKLRMVGETWSQGRIEQMGDASVLDGDGSDWKPR